MFLLQDYEEITLELMSLSGWSQEDKLPPESLHSIIMSMADRIHTRQTQLGFHPVVMLVGSVFLFNNHISSTPKTIWGGYQIQSVCLSMCLCFSSDSCPIIDLRC